MTSHPLTLHEKTPLQTNVDRPQMNTFETLDEKSYILTPLYTGIKMELDGVIQ